MNFNSSSDVGHISHRQPRFFGPLLGFVLASIFPSLGIARLQHGSIKFQYDPIIPNQIPPINIYQTPRPVWPVAKPPEIIHEHPDPGHHHHDQDLPHHYHDPDLPTNIERPSDDYLYTDQSQISKVMIKRAATPRYLGGNYRRINRYGALNRKRFPNYFDYDNYDYASPRLQQRKRINAKRPAGFDFDDYYDYDYGRPFRKQQRKKIKNKPRRDPDYYADDPFADDVEQITPVLRPRQQQTTTNPTTTTEMTTPVTTTITNGTVSTTPTSASTTNGYGPYTGNENISITYGPPPAAKPVYGVPSGWSPSYPFDQNAVYSQPSPFYNSPLTAYGSPGPTGSAQNFQSFQMPVSSWYGRSSSEDLVRRVQDINRYDQ